MGDKIFDYYGESQADKLKRKSQESPFMIIGLCGLLGVCGVAAYKFKSKGDMSTSVFLMQLRVVAQGAVVGSLSAGILYSMVNDYILNPKKGS